MERALATIQRINNLRPIEGADRIEVAEILGWRVVVRKGEFQINDRCVYFELDSVLPDSNPAFDFLGKKKRLRTIRLRGQLSQGLALPLDVVFEHTGYPLDILGNVFIEDGMDVTEFLGIKKYEPETNKPFYKDKATFPSFIPKTDEIRVQSFPKVMDEVRNVSVYMTVKLDGSSLTAYKHNGEYGVCSRRNTVSSTESLYGIVAAKYNLEEVLPEGYAIQGEMCGPKVQGNKLKLDELDLFVYNVFNIKEGRYLDFTDFITFCAEYGLSTVPIHRVHTDVSDWTLDDYLDEAEGRYKDDGFDFIKSTWQREGIVVRPVKEMFSEVLTGRLSFKVINNKFLEAGGD